MGEEGTKKERRAKAKAEKAKKEEAAAKKEEAAAAKRAAQELGTKILRRLRRRSRKSIISSWKSVQNQSKLFR